MAGGVESMLAGVIVSELGATAAARGCGRVLSMTASGVRKELD